MVQLIVNNEPLDLLEKPSMSIQVSDVADIESRQGDYTYEFELPATQQNRRLLKRSHYIYGSPYQLIDAWIRSSTDVKRGFIQVAEYDRTFRVNFFSGNSNWIALIGDRLLSDLDLTRYNHTYNRDNVVASFSNTEGYIYPYVNAFSGLDREAFVGLVYMITTIVSDWIHWDDLSSNYYNQGQYEKPFYTLEDDYTLSIYCVLEVTAITGSSTIGIYKRLTGGYVGLDTEVVSSTGTYTFKYSGDFREGDAVGSYILIGSGQISISTSSYIRFTTSFSELDSISFLDLYPAMYVHSIVKHIFQEIGFKLSGPFLNNADYRRMIMPFTGTTFGVSDTVIVSKSLYLGLIGDFTLDDPEEAIYWSDFTSPYYYPVGFYSSPRYVADGNYSIDIEVVLNASDSGVTTSDIEIRKNGVAIFTETILSLGETTYNVNSVVMASGDYIEVWITTGDYLTVTTGSSFKVTALNDIVGNTDVIASGVLPEMKQIDLLKYLFVSFGIVPEVDDFSKTLKLTEFREIRNKPPEDWSAKLAGDYSINFYDFSSDLNKLNNFKYKDYDEDFRLENYLSKNKQAYGDGQIRLDNVFLTGEGDVIENEFVASFFEEVTINEKTANLATYARDKNPRILFVVPNATVSDFSDFGEIAIDGEPYSVTNIAWAYFAKHKLGSDLDNFDTNLSYTMPTMLNPNGRGLLAKYWGDYSGILERPKMLVVDMKLSQKDIITLDFTRRKYINADNITGYYYLNKIRNYDFDNGLAECEFMLIDNLDTIEVSVLTEPRGTDAILLETSDYILEEDGDKILLE